MEQQTLAEKKLEELKKKEGEERKENEERKQLSFFEAKSSISDLCRICVTPGAIGDAAVLELWYSGDEQKLIRELAQKLERQEITVEDFYSELFCKIPRVVEGLNRIYNDRNRVMEVAMELAIQKKPELAGELQPHLDELKNLNKQAFQKQ